MLRKSLASLAVKAANAVEGTMGHFEIGVSNSQEEFKASLQRRGIDIQKLASEGCSCGEIREINEIVAVDKVEGEIQLYCKHCFR